MVAWAAPDNLMVVLPACNEAGALPALLHRLAEACGAELRVLVVDDGSTDNTAGVAEAMTTELPRLSVIRHAGNQGLGAALRTGWERAVAALPDDGIIVTMDADDTHDPALIGPLARLVEAGCDVAIASRFAPGGREIGLSLSRRLMSYGARVFLSGLRRVPGVTDYTCGYRAYRAGLLRRALCAFAPAGLITVAGFACTAEVLLKLAMLGARCGEAPLVLHYDQKVGRSKMRLGRTLAGYAQLLSATSRAGRRA